MDQFDGTPGGAFSADPQVDLKSKGLPWPVYLAIGMAAVAGIGFLGLRAAQTRKTRELHAEFMSRFMDFEKDDVGGYWRCLFGKEGDGRRFSLPEQYANAVDSALMIDPKGFPDKVRDECVPKLTRVASKIRDLNPPLEYSDSVDKYARAMQGMANAMSAWAENAPKRYQTHAQQKKIEDAGNVWSAGGNPRKPDPAALVYDKFLHCAVPGVDKMKDGEELLTFLAAHCLQNAGKGWKIDKDFVTRLRETCIPEAATATDLKPSSSFAVTQTHMVADYENISQATDKCFKEAYRGARQDDAAGLGKTWMETFNASSNIRKIGTTLLKND